jgi:multidrug efflux pump subunit AcrB
MAPTVSVTTRSPGAMRVWMNPNLLQSFGLTPDNVVKPIQQQSQEVTAGVIGMPPAPKGQAQSTEVEIYNFSLRKSLRRRNCLEKAAGRWAILA